MEKKISIQRALVRDDLKATLVCPECRASKSIDVRQFKQGQHRLKVHCTCGKTFHAQLEFRRFIRKDTSLGGIYKTPPPSAQGGRIGVINLSMGGACFEVRGRHDLKIGQKGCIVFTLDNRKQAVLTRDLVIKSIDNKKIGCEFIHDKAYDRELGFYMLP